MKIGDKVKVNYYGDETTGTVEGFADWYDINWVLVKVDDCSPLTDVTDIHAFEIEGVKIIEE